MARYRDPNAPEGRVVFGGEAFIDGVTADITPGEETLRLFKGAGITAVPDTEPDVDPADDTEKRAARRKK